MPPSERQRDVVAALRHEHFAAGVWRSRYEAAFVSSGEVLRVEIAVARRAGTEAFIHADIASCAVPRDPSA
jgi:hypothetical protein